MSGTEALMMLFPLLAGHEARRVQALQEEDEEDEQTDGGRAQTGRDLGTPPHSPGLIKKISVSFSLNCYSSVLLSEISVYN